MRRACRARLADGRPILAAAMAKVCHSCGKGPAFGQSRCTRWSPPSAGSTRTSRRCGSSRGARRSARYVCTRCLKAGKVTKASSAASTGSRPTMCRSEPPPLPRRRRGRRWRTLESRREEVNDLNVFPVADGDTGDNMALTLRAVLDELDRLADAGRRSTRSAATEIVDSVARAALLGARGNSRRHPLPADPRRGRGAHLPAGRARRPGAGRRRAWPARPTAPTARVRDPAEGTILTVVREMADRVAIARSRTWTSRACGTASATRRRTSCSPTCSSSALDAGRGLGQARPRAAADPARGGRRRRRRLRADDHLRRRHRGAARAPTRRRSSTTRRRGSPTRSTSPRPTATARTSPSPARASTATQFVARLEAARRLRARRRRPRRR